MPTRASTSMEMPPDGRQTALSAPRKDVALESKLVGNAMIADFACGLIATMVVSAGVFVRYRQQRSVRLKTRASG